MPHESRLSEPHASDPGMRGIQRGAHYRFRGESSLKSWASSEDERALRLPSGSNQCLPTGSTGSFEVRYAPFKKQLPDLALSLLFYPCRVEIPLRGLARIDVLATIADRLGVKPDRLVRGCLLGSHVLPGG